MPAGGAVVVARGAVVVAGGAVVVAGGAVVVSREASNGTVVGNVRGWVETMVVTLVDTLVDVLVGCISVVIIAVVLVESGDENWLNSLVGHTSCSTEHCSESSSIFTCNSTKYLIDYLLTRSTTNLNFCETK